MNNELVIEPHWKIGDLVMISQPVWLDNDCSIGRSNVDGYIGVVVRLHSMKYPDKFYMDWVKDYDHNYHDVPRQDPDFEASLEFIYNVYVNSFYRWYRASELIEVI